MATDSDIPRAMSEIPLPPPPPPPADMIAFLDKCLDKDIDAEFITRLLSPEHVAQTAVREAEQRAADWPALARYRVANLDVTSQPDMVMIGDSITEIWALADPGLFDERILNRGISGQTSAQILLRCYADVIDLHPRRVHVLCGTNDIAGNTGPMLPQDYERNVKAILDLAVANGIEPLLGSITPAASIFWSPEARPLEWVPRLNDSLRDLAVSRGARFIDYHAALTNGSGALRHEFSSDGVHVTRSAYRTMRALLEEATR